MSDEIKIEELQKLSADLNNTARTAKQVRQFAKMVEASFELSEKINTAFALAAQGLEQRAVVQADIQRLTEERQELEANLKARQEQVAAMQADLDRGLAEAQAQHAAEMERLAAERKAAEDQLADVNAQLNALKAKLGNFLS